MLIEETFNIFSGKIQSTIVDALGAYVPTITGAMELRDKVASAPVLDALVVTSAKTPEEKPDDDDNAYAGDETPPLRGHLLLVGRCLCFQGVIVILMDFALIC